MANPIITIRSSDDSEAVTTVAFGAVDAGGDSGEVTIRVWNNYGGGSVVDDATSCSLAIKTYNGLNTGDTNANGQEVVTDGMVVARCTTYGDAEFSSIGGTITIPIGYTTSTATLKGDYSTASNCVATVVLKLVCPASDYTATAFNAKLTVLYTGGS